MMRIKQTHNMIVIKNYPTPFGKRDITIHEYKDIGPVRYSGDYVEYNDRYGNLIGELFRNDGLYDCLRKKLQGEEPWLIERTGRVPNGDLCLFCKHRKHRPSWGYMWWRRCVNVCEYLDDEDKFKHDNLNILECDNYQRWDE